MVGDHRQIGDYSAEETELLLGIAADLLRSFGSAFGGRHLAIVGGLVPTLLMPDLPTGIAAHPGTGDLDLHLSLHLLDGETGDYYDSIVEGLSKLGLKPATENKRLLKWRWVGTFRGVRMTVEFLCPARTRGGVPEAPARGTLAEQNVGPTEAIRALGLRFGHFVPLDTITVDRRVPTVSGNVTYPFPVADVTSWLCLKSDAIVLRDKPKDAFDVTWVVDAIRPESVATRIASSALLGADERDQVIAQLRQLTEDQFRDLARRVEAVAAERGATVESTTVELLSAALGEPRHEATPPAKRTLAFAAIGASGSSRGAAHAWIDSRAGRVTLKEYANEWLVRRPHLAVRAVKLYRYLLDSHIRIIPS